MKYTKLSEIWAYLSGARIVISVDIYSLVRIITRRWILLGASDTTDTKPQTTDAVPDILRLIINQNQFFKTCINSQPFLFTNEQHRFQVNHR